MGLGLGSAGRRPGLRLSLTRDEQDSSLGPALCVAWLGGMGATRRTIPSTPTALVCVSRPSRAQAEVGGSSSRARAAAQSACASARSRLVAGRYYWAAGSAEACEGISDGDREASFVA